MPDTLSALYEYPDRFHLNYSCFFGNDQYGYGEQFMGQKGTIEVMDRQNLHFYPQPKFIKGAKPFSKQTSRNSPELHEGLQPAGRHRRSRPQLPRCGARERRRPSRRRAQVRSPRFPATWRRCPTSRASGSCGTKRPRSIVSSSWTVRYGYLRRNRSTSADSARSARLPPLSRCAAPSPALKAPSCWSAKTARWWAPSAAAASKPKSGMRRAKSSRPKSRGICTSASGRMPRTITV